MTIALIRIAAALLVRNDGRTLLVRKRGSASFIQPGGKIDPRTRDHVLPLCRTRATPGGPA